MTFSISKPLLWDNADTRLKRSQFMEQLTAYVLRLQQS